MAIIRLGVATPAANSPVQLTAVLNSHLASVVIANTSNQASPVCKVDVYVVPQGAGTESEYAYIASNLEVPVGSSFETFRFSLNPSDAIYVKSTIAGTSFSAYGLLQSEDVGPGDLPAVFRNKIIRGINNVLYVDKGPTGTRPVAAEVGYIRFNTDFDALEVRTAAGWKTVTAVSS
jgi:hypothetical protein